MKTVDKPTTPVSWAEVVDVPEKPSWADQVEEEETEELVKTSDLPPAVQKIVGNIKTVTEYKLNEDGKKVKVIRKYKIETKKTSKSVARRKLLRKFGLSELDGSGPNRATTMVSEDVQMQFISSRQDDLMQDQEDPTLSKFKHQLQYYMFFKNFKATQKDSSKDNEDEEKNAEETDNSGISAPGKYVPPSMRSGGNTMGSSMPSGRGNRDEQATQFVSQTCRKKQKSRICKNYSNHLALFKEYIWQRISIHSSLRVLHLSFSIIATMLPRQ